MTATTSTDLSRWIGKTETVDDTVTATPYAALSATLDRPAERPPVGTPLPPLWHWLYFLPLYRQSEVGPDGHAKRGSFLPPVPLPRRMWAGSQFEFRTPLRVGARGIMAHAQGLFAGRSDLVREARSFAAGRVSR